MLDIYTRKDIGDSSYLLTFIYLVLLKMLSYLVLFYS